MIKQYAIVEIEEGTDSGEVLTSPPGVEVIVIEWRKVWDAVGEESVLLVEALNEGEWQKAIDLYKAFTAEPPDDLGGDEPQEVVNP